MAFKMKGHALKGPHSFAKQKAKDYERLKKAETEVKTQMYDLAEPGTAAADSTGGTYSEENMKRIEKAQADYNKAVERAKKAGIKFDDSPLPQNNKKTNKANKAIDKANTATAAANAYLMEHGTKNDDGSYSLSEEHMKKYNKLKGKADKKGGKAEKKSQKAIDAGAERSPMEQSRGDKRRVNRANRKIGRYNKAANRYMRFADEHGELGQTYTFENPDGSKNVEKYYRYDDPKDYKKAQKLQGKAEKKRKKADKAVSKTPSMFKKRAPYKVAPLVAAAGKMAAKAVAGQVASKAAKKATGGDE